MEKKDKKKSKSAKLNHKIFVGLMLGCITWLIYSSCFMLVNGGMTYDAVKGALLEVLPYSIIIGAFGIIVGDILDKPNKYKAERENKELIDRMLKSVADQAAQTAQINPEGESPSISEDIKIQVDTENNN